MELIDNILKDLVPYMDKVVIHPVSTDQIGEIENRLNKELPKYFKYYLERIGLKQDLVFGLFQTTNQFNDVSQFIDSQDYFRFRHNGGEDYWLLKFDDEESRIIYEFDYYANGEILNTGKTFDSILIEAAKEVKNRYPKMISNSDKRWVVEFSMGTGSGKFLEKELGKFLNVKLISDPKKIFTEKGEIGYENGFLEIEGETVALKKYHFNGSSLAFDWCEPVEAMKINARIDRIDAALKKCPFKHSMVTYGFLTMEDLDS